MHLYCMYEPFSLSLSREESQHTKAMRKKRFGVYAIAPNNIISDNTIPIATATAIAKCANVCEKCVASFLHLLSIHSLCLALHLSISPSRSRFLYCVCVLICIYLCCTGIHRICFSFVPIDFAAQ